MTPRVKRYSRLLRKVPLLMVAELTVLLVRMYTELSNARTLVERKLMSTTSPETSPTVIQSPMEKGAVQQDDQPAEQVFGAVLRSQRDGQTDKTRTGYDAAHRQAALLCHGHNAQHHDENFVHLVQQGG